MSIILACDSFLSLRNVRNGDLGRRLAALTGLPVVVLVDPAQYEGSAQACPPGVTLDRLLNFSAEGNHKLVSLLEASILSRKCHLDAQTIWSLLRFSASRRTFVLRRWLAVARARCRFYRYRFDGWRGLAQSRRRAVAQALRRHPVAAEYQRRFETWSARLIVGFSLEGPREMALIEAANAAGIPTAVMIRSRDNLAAKIPHLPDALAYLVWSDFIRDFLLHLYPEIPPGRVHVTGSPQFDRHLNPDFRLPREEFFRRIGLDARRPLIVYTTATPRLIDHEIHIVQHLADAVRDGRLRRGGVPAQLLVRGHPRGFGADIPLVHRLHPGVAVYPPPGTATYRSPEHEAQVVRLILEDEPMHLSTLAYQDVQVNVSGTMTVDSAIFDKPVVNIYYDLPADVPAGLSVRHFYERSDYKPIVASGGVRLARSPEECLSLINQYLENPALDAAGRKWIRETDCGPLDGRAGERIAQRLASLCRLVSPAGAVLV